MIHPLMKFGSYGQWIFALAVGLCSFTAGQILTWPAATLPMFRDGMTSFSMSSDEQSWMSTTTFISNSLSPIPAGYIMDWIGRKNTLLISNLLAIGSWIVVYFGQSAVGLFVARALTGTWCGIVYTVVPVLIGETFNAEVRGSMFAVFGIMLYLGALYETIIGMFVSYNTLTLISLIPSVFLLCNLAILPESAQFYLMKGKKVDAGESIEWLRGSCTASELDVMEDSVKGQLANRGTFLQIFAVKPYRKALIMAVCLTSFRSMAGLSLLSTYSTLVLPPLEGLDSEESNIFLIMTWICGSVSSYFIMDKFDRRILLFISSMGSCLTMLSVAIWYYCRDFTSADTNTSEWYPLIGLMANGLIFSMGLVSIPILIQGEIFPVNIKAKASACACISIALTSGISVKLYEPLTDIVGVFSNFLVCSISSALGAIFACTYMIETRGKTIEEIQDDLSGISRK